MTRATGTRVQASEEVLAEYDTSPLHLQTVVQFARVCKSALCYLFAVDQLTFDVDSLFFRRMASCPMVYSRISSPF
jgi:hypothetical protein